jgi:hypothetical protein
MTSTGKVEYWNDRVADAPNQRYSGTHFRRLPKIPGLPGNPIPRGSRIVEKSLAQKCLGLASENDFGSGNYLPVGTVAGAPLRRLERESC